MTYQRNSIAFPVLDTLLKLLSDRQWHNKAFIKRDWKQIIPPEYFSRRMVNNPYWSNAENKMVSSGRTNTGIVDRHFKRTINNCIKCDYIEIRELGVSQMENYDIRITDAGIVRLKDGARGTRFITYNGETSNLTKFCEKMNLDINRFRFWLDRKKVTIEEAIKKSGKDMPPLRSRLITHNGETKTLSEWCRFYNVSRPRMHFYLTKMTFEGALERCKEPKPS